MFKKTSCLFVLILIVLIFVSSMFGATKKQTFRYNYPSRALYQVVTVVWEEPVAADPNKIVANAQISTHTLIALTTGFNMAITAQTDCSRVFTCILSSACIGTTAVVTATLDITGTDSTGIDRTETISVSSISATGNYAFGYVTLVVLKMTAGTGWEGTGATVNSTISVDVGVGAELGLPFDLDSSTDVYICIEDDLATYPGSKTDITYNTITFATAPDATRDYKIEALVPLRKKSVYEINN